MSWKGNKMANGEIYEKNLSNASGIGSGDYLRTVNSNNESEKIDYTLLAKAIIEQWAGSSLAGSAQSVKSAINTLNSKNIYAGGCVGVRYATSGENIASIRWLFVGNAYLELSLNSTSISFRYYNGSSYALIWAK
jgi:hypothetical protein